MKSLDLLTIPETLRLFPSKNEANKSKEGPRMPTILKVEDLHEAYHAASKEDAIAMANLGAICYQSVREGLFAQWSTAEDVAKADTWREEGRQSMFETLKSKLAAAEGMSVRLLAAETALEEAHSAMETRISGRVSETLDSFRKDYELVKMKEIAAMQQRIAAAEAREEMIEMVKKSNTAMEEKIALLEGQVAEQLAANTKSSHAIGKAGEAEVFELLQMQVVPELLHADVKNMSGTSHTADFHLRVMLPSGKNMKILIDSKKYVRPVKSDEINKLISDVDTNEDAHAGMMISLNSSICTMKQFQIKNTDKGKPIIYLSFQDIDAELHGKLICWGVRALMSAAREEKGDISITTEKMEDCFNEIVAKLGEVDGNVKVLTKTIESLRRMRRDILESIVNFKTDAGFTEKEEPLVMEDGCAVIMKTTGTRCGKELFNGGAKCRNHTSKKDKV